MALGPGSIAFVGVNTAGTPDDWIAFAALDDIPEGTVIYFTDNELTGATFNTGESYAKWTAPVGGITAGTVVKLTTFDTTPVASTGTASAVTFALSANRGLSQTADSVYAYLAGSDASADTPVTHLAYLNIGNAVDGTAPAALAANELVSFTSGADSAVYAGTHSGQSGFSGYLDLISNTANWTAVSGPTASGSLNSTSFTTASPAQTVGFAPGTVSVSHAEGNSGTTDFTFTIERSGGSTGQVDFSGTVSAGATNAADFGGVLPTSFSGSIADGALSADVTIHVSGDVSFESNEGFGLTLNNATNVSATVTLGTTDATGTIQDDDVAFGVDLSTYVRVGRFDLPEPTRTVAPPNSLLAQEASAVTYNWDTDTLFVVGDGGTSVVQVSKTGQLIDSMTLSPGNSPQGTEFYDTEGLTYVGNGQFVMTEERDRQAVLFTYDAGTTLTRDETQTVKLGTTIGNVGLEGVTNDPQTGGFIFVKELTPEGIFQTNIDFAAGTATNGSPSTDNSTNLFDPSLVGTSDFSDVYSLANIPLLNGQPDGSHLLILSQESGKIVEVDRSGTIFSTLTITADPGNPLSVPDQTHEGVAMDRAGNLYVVSENGGGDFDHPQLWVYSRSTATNLGPTAVTLSNQVNSLAENTSTAARVKVADVAIADDGLGTNNLSLSGADASFFQVDSTGLYIKAGTVLDFETKASYAVTVNVDDPSVGASPDASTNFSLNLTDVVNETPGQPVIFISEVAPWSSGNSVTLGADWFEVTNSGNSAINISGWKVDDNSNSFGSSVALNGITSIAAGESVIFIETDATKGQTAAGNAAAFKSEWFNGTAPAGLQIGSYGGGGVGLSTGGDAVNLFTSGGALVANVTFGGSPGASPFATFDNTAGLDNAAITQLSAVGQNNAFSITHNTTTEIGSPGTVGKLFISEVAPWSSGNSPLAADWFEVTNSTTSAINISGWTVDDSSNSFGSSLALNGITTIGAGESVIFIETGNAQTAAGNAAAFKNIWFGGHAPAGLQIGSYSGGGIGLSTGGDAVNLYNSAGVLQANVSFGANAGSLGSPPTLLQTFDNAAGLNNTTISLLSTAGQNSAYAVTHGGSSEIGSPGEITPINDAPIAGDDSLPSIAEDSGTLSISFASLTGNDLTGPPSDNGQTLTITNVTNAVGGTVSIVGTNVMFAPTANYNGPASFDYTVQDNGTSYGANHFLTDIGSVSFTITPVNDPPAITSPDTFTVAENHAAVGTVVASDPDSAFTFAVTGGVDGGLFSINPNSGALSFKTSPDFESPQDSGPDNVYDLIVTVTDTVGDSSQQAISVTVTDVSEVGQIANGGSGNDTLPGTTGNDTMNGAGGSDLLSGGDGNDIVSGSNGNDTIDGGRGGDVLNGGFGTDSIDGGDGSDVVFGDTGNDHLNGGDGDDAVQGGDGNDTADGGNGNDAMTGGNGADQLSGSDGDDNLTGDVGLDTLNGGNDNDYLSGGDGNDQLNGGDGNDTGFGDAGSDSLDGGNGNDNLAGGTGTDSLNGGSGADSLAGGTGKDVLTGGADADVFMFGVAKGVDADHVADFETGVDTLQFFAADYGLPAGVLDASNLVFGISAADHHSEFVYDAASGKLMWDADGIGGKALVLVATFDNAAALTHSDFILV